MADAHTQYFKSYDKFTLRGTGRLERAPTDRPYVAITATEDRARVTLGLFSGRGIDFQVVYDRRDGVFTSDNTVRYPDEPLPWRRRVVYLDAGVEHSYVYFYGDNPSEPGAPPVLAEYIRATPGEQQVWTFPVFVDAGESASQVRELLTYNREDPLPARIRDKAGEESSNRDRLEPGRLVRTQVVRFRGPEYEGEDEQRNRYEFDTSYYPAAFVDHFGAMMLVDDIDE